ncbi:MAG: hypothetical protein AUJ52_14490 [Elusimicrobia bacterium CG1_02_63_36]|nr:MAG: hypothetical protein AUJ52_14490 [Elusimicrobia bacterium CG1_02_63_36]PJA16584.1 MAG: hypothetical protein COX66_07165 [Elusimicrobia bacterium CG_4_10_14_0_2_um_filter_63_34]PJB26686.1 MAG: hypothetical protein CO113_02275 [Elusimicrobia bacterium CG_4_9_14_3_um_filter_62_55]
MNEQQTEDQKDEKKGGAAPWMQGPANVGSGSLGGAGIAGSSGGGLAGGSGMIGAVKAALGKKMIFALLLGGGVSAGGLIGMQDFSQPSDPGSSVFVAREPAASAGGPIIEQAGDGTYNALELARQANSGAMGEMEGQVAEGGGAAEGEGAASAEGVDSAEAAADAPGAIAGMDPDAMAKMAAGMAGEEESKAKKGLGQKFGKLSSSLGGGSGPKLAGGAGLSGGIGGAFKQKPLSNKAGGQLSAVRGSRQVSRTKTAVGAHGKNAKKGAFNRLNSMNKAMGNARTGTAAQTAAAHSQQWDSAKDAGAGITGAGASVIGAGGGSEFSEDEGAANGSPLDAGGSQNSIGDEYQGPETGGGTNATPYQGTMDMLIGLMAIINVLFIVIGIAAIIKDTGFLAAVGAALFSAVMGIIAVLSAVVLAGALMIGQKYGQSAQSNLLATSAALSLTLGAIGFFSKTFAAGMGWVMLLGGIAGLAMNMTSMSKSNDVETDKVKNPDATASSNRRDAESPGSRLAKLLTERIDETA